MALSKSIQLIPLPSNANTKPSQLFSLANSKALSNVDQVSGLSIEAHCNFPFSSRPKIGE